MEDVPEEEIPHVRITFEGRGNYSEMSLSSLVNLKSHSMRLSNLGERRYYEKKFFILHEFGHVLGLSHEHQSPKTTFKLDWDQLYEYCKRIDKWDKKRCEKNYSKKKTDENWHISAYDPYSIMHYELHNNNVIPQEDFINHPSASLSLIDKLEISKLYPYKIDPEEIVLEHESYIQMIKETHQYKNCHIKKRFSGKMEYYIFKQTNKLHRRNTYQPWKTKEIALIQAKSNEYCNYNDLELENYENEIKEEMEEKRFFGSCMIARKGDKTRDRKKCPEEDYYRIVQQDLSETAVKACYPNYFLAVRSMRKASSCSEEQEKADSAALDD